MALNVCTEYEKPESFMIRDTSLAVSAPRMAVQIAPLRSIYDLLYNRDSSLELLYCNRCARVTERYDSYQAIAIVPVLWKTDGLRKKKR